MLIGHRVLLGSPPGRWFSWAGCTAVFILCFFVIHLRSKALQSEARGGSGGRECDFSGAKGIEANEESAGSHVLLPHLLCKGPPHS